MEEEEFQRYKDKRREEEREFKNKDRCDLCSVLIEEGRMEFKVKWTLGSFLRKVLEDGERSYYTPREIKLSPKKTCSGCLLKYSALKKTGSRWIRWV